MNQNDQQELPLPTEFEMITAWQLMYNPSDKAIDKAIELVSKWNKHRISKGLKPW